MKRVPTVREGVEIAPIPEMIRRSGEKFKDKIALKIERKDLKETLTYQEMIEKVSLFARGIKKLGFGKNSKIALIGENRPSWAIAYLGIQWTGAVVVPLDPQLKSPEIKHILIDSESEALVYSKMYEEVITEAVKGLKNIKLLICMDKVEEKTKKIIWMEDVIQNGKEVSYFPPQPSLDDLSVLIYTSGTTGQSKGVMLSHRNIASNINSMYQAVYFDEKDRFISILPLHHTFEATCGFLAPLVAGCEIIYTPSLKSKEILDTMKKHKVTLMLGVPLLFEKIVLGIKRNVKEASAIKKTLFKTFYGLSKIIKPVSKLPGKVLFKGVRGAIGFENLRLVVSGGAALPRWVSDFLENIGVNILQGYGLTESSPVLTVNRAEKPKNESVGPPVPDVEIKIDSPDENGVGEICAKGPNIMLGYYKNKKATQEVLKDGWLYTGDLGWIDKEGYLYITGRKKNLIVTAAGKNVYPEEIEEKLLESPYIKEVLVIGKENPVTGREEVHAIIHPDYEEIDKMKPDATEEEITELLKEEIKKYTKELADYKRVKSFEIREEEFPKTTTKKIKRYLFIKKPVKI